MRRLTVGLLAALALVALPAAQAPAHAPSAHASCTSATIVHQHKCLRVGEFCTHTRRANHDYHRYGYTCGKRDRNGRYHLQYY